MQLKYVGDMPLISKNGVAFDHTQPDRYKFLQATVELLEALSYGETTTTQHLYKIETVELNADELMHLIQKHVPNLEHEFESCDKKAHDLVHDLVNRVKENDALSEDEKLAWLENIKLMRAYFYQHVINKCAYEEALKALGDEIEEGHIKEIKVPMFKNYGIVLNDMIEVLLKRKAPIDSELKIDNTSEGLVGILILHHS